MAKIYTPHAYQRQAIDAILDNPKFALFLDMGLGKTIISLTAFTELQNSMCINNVLIVGPKKVAESTWDAECEKWEHTKGLKVSKILGTQDKRIKALNTEADIYVINRENVVWLVDYLESRKIVNPFDMLIIDELSSFKSHSARRFKTLKKLAFSRVIGLTGTPAPNGYLDLWSQIYLLDKGKRLGKTITQFRNDYFTPGWGNGNVVYKYNLRNGAGKTINKLLSDICLSMKAEDYLQLPERIDDIIRVELSNNARKLYKEFEKESIMNLGDEPITAMNAASLSNKLCQFANGAIYDDERNVHHIHDDKLDALDELIEKAGDQPLLVAYTFKHDLSRLLERYPQARLLKDDNDLRAWNDGKIKMLLAHPASAGHGLNLQAGGSIIVWFGLPWSLELYQQFNGRLHRQGQTKPVYIQHLVASGTFDERIVQVLTDKAVTQDDILSALKNYLQTN